MRRVGRGVLLGLVALGMVGCASLAGPEISTMCVKQWGTLTFPVKCPEVGVNAR